MQEFKQGKGSYSRVFQDIAQYFTNYGYETTILAPQFKNQQKKEIEEYAKIIRFSILKFPIFSNVIISILFAFHMILFFNKNKLNDMDVIIANGDAALGLPKGKFILRLPDQPAKTYLKSMELAKESSFLTSVGRFIHIKLINILEIYYIKKAKAVISASNISRQDFVKQYSIKGGPYFIPHAGIDLKKFKKKHTTKRKEKTLLFISSYKERIRKGLPLLEKTLPKVFKKYKNVKLIHLGEKFEWNIPERYKKNIISIGKVSNQEVQKYYASSDIFLSCSIHEMIPNTLLEAMASGLPVLFSDIIGIHEYIQHKKSGYIFQRGNSEELYQGITFLLENPKLRKKMAGNARKKVAKLDKRVYYKRLYNFIQQTYQGKKDSVNLLE